MLNFKNHIIEIAYDPLERSSTEGIPPMVTSPRVTIGLNPISNHPTENLRTIMLLLIARALFVI